MSRLPKVRSIGITVAVAAALLLALAPISASARPLGAPARHAPRAAVGGDSWRLFKATNESRGRFDVPKLRLNRELSVIARRHSMAMARSGDAVPHGERRRLPARHRLAHLGRERRVHTGDVDGMEQAFMDSPPHRGNILNRAFRQVAIGSVRVDGTLWVTVFFFG